MDGHTDSPLKVQESQGWLRRELRARLAQHRWVIRLVLALLLLCVLGTVWELKQYSAASKIAQEYMQVHPDAVSVPDAVFPGVMRLAYSLSSWLQIAFLLACLWAWLLLTAPRVEMLEAIPQPVPIPPASAGWKLWLSLGLGLLWLPVLVLNLIRWLESITSTFMAYQYFPDLRADGMSALMHLQYQRWGFSFVSVVTFAAGLFFALLLLSIALHLRPVLLRAACGLLCLGGLYELRIWLRGHLTQLTNIAPFQDGARDEFFHHIILPGILTVSVMLILLLLAYGGGRLKPVFREHAAG